MKILAVLSAAIFTVCLAELEPKCAWGQTYWCSDLELAKSCGAIEHCKSTTWKNQLTKQDVRDSCTFCKALIDDVKRYMKLGKTEVEISHFLSAACSILPDSSSSAKCKKVTEGMITDVLQLVSSNVEAQMVCALMGVCTAGLEDTVQHSPIVKPSVEEPRQTPATSDERKLLALDGVREEQICTDCKKFFTDIQQMITANKTEAEVEQLIGQAICSQLGSLEDECKALVHEFIPEIMQMMSAYYDPKEICQSLGVCSSSSVEVRYQLLFTRLRQLPFYKAAASQNSASTCLVCKTVMAEIQVLSRDKAVQEQLKGIIKSQLCSRIGSLKETCELMVEMYSAELFEVLINIVEPSTRCRSLGFCDAIVGNKKSADVMPALPLTPAKPASRVATDPSPECTVCEYLVKEIQDLLEQNTTEEEIIAELEKACSLLPDTYAKACKDYVDKYAKIVIEMLIQEVDPDKVCIELGLCTGREEKSKLSDSVKRLLSVKGSSLGDKDPSPECEVCEYLIKEIQQLISQNTSEEEIIQALEQACTYMPESLAKTCKDYVDKYAKIIIEMLIHEVDPETVCVELGLCTGVKMVTSKVQIPVKSLISIQNYLSGQGKSNSDCEICQQFMAEIKILRDLNATVEEIIDALAKTCDIVPNVIAKNCRNIVDTYAKSVIEKIKQGVDPKTICTDIGLCPPGKIAPHLVPIKVSPPGGNGEACAVCETLIQYLEALLEQNSTMEQIEAMLDKMCGYLPASIVTECEDLVKQYGDLIIHYVSTLASPKEVCKLIGVCENSVKLSAGVSGVNRVSRLARATNGNSLIELEKPMIDKPEIKQQIPLLGENECTWGPSHWCSSLKVANDCKRLDYCREVWGKDEP